MAIRPGWRWRSLLSPSRDASRTRRVAGASRASPTLPPSATPSRSGGGTGEERFPLGEFPLTARVLHDQEAVQVLVGDPEADRREVELMLSLGHRSLLIVPVVSRGESLGIVEAYSNHERPWTRTEINQARIISNQFGSVILALFRSSAALAD